PTLAPEVRIVAFPPGLGPSQPGLTALQQRPQVVQADGGHHPLLGQIVPKPGQRPIVHPDQLSRRRLSRCPDLLDYISLELPRLTPATTVDRIPGDRLDPAVVETVDDLANPAARTVRPFGNLPVGQPAHGQ